MNIFKTIEGYKKIPHVAGRQDQLRVARGVWVSGTHTDPLTEDALIHIEEVFSNQAEVRVYTESTTSIDTDVLYTLKGFDSEAFTYVDYTTAETDWDQEISYVNVTNIYAPALTFVPYIITNMDVDQEVSYVNVTNIYTTALSFISNYVDKQYANTQPEPTLYVTEFTSNSVELA